MGRDGRAGRPVAGTWRDRPTREPAETTNSDGAAMVRFLANLLKIVWAGPASLLGLAIGVICLATGGSACRRGRTLEFYGGSIAAVFAWIPLAGNAMAMTLGHVILAVDRASLEFSRGHELVHVRQYERWGPALLPAYLLASLWLWLRKRDPYHDNPFEREAYRDERG